MDSLNILSLQQVERLCITEVSTLHGRRLLMASLQDNHIWLNRKQGGAAHGPVQWHSHRFGGRKDNDFAYHGGNDLHGEAVSPCGTLETPGNEASQDLFKDLSFNSQRMTTNFQRALFEFQTWKMTFS